MNITSTTVAFEVDDPDASSRFFTDHFGFREVVAAESLVALGRDDSTVDIVLVERDPQAPPRDSTPVLVSFTVAGINGENLRLNAEGAMITRPLRREPWGEWTLRLTDPNGIVVQLVEWEPPPGPAPEPLAA